MKNTQSEFTPGMKGYDIIGDIHGHADELKSLLSKLGYQHGGQFYSHPAGRRIVFLGDWIDRGPKIREVLKIVRGMLEGGEALAVLGNHEVNAMRFHSLGSDGNPLRPHTPKNVKQHQATLDQFPDVKEWTEWIHWFAGLPLSLDLGGLRAVHACWDDEAIRELNAIGRWEGKVLECYSRKGSREHETISQVINGPEAQLPEGFLNGTADGTMRSEIRVKWWRDLNGANCREAIFPDDPKIPEIPLGEVPRTGFSPDSPPTFFGHYALKEAAPARIAPNLACLDYGTGKGGFLCAYRWDGESIIDPGKFTTSKQSEEDV